MENQITCPHCKRTISSNLVIDSSAKGTGNSSDFITCECGERITYWAITAQLRDQKKLGKRFQNWLRNIFKSPAS